MERDNARNKRKGQGIKHGAIESGGVECRSEEILDKWKRAAGEGRL